MDMETEGKAAYWQKMLEHALGKMREQFKPQPKAVAVEIEAKKLPVEEGAEAPEEKPEELMEALAAMLAKK